MNTLSAEGQFTIQFINQTNRSIFLTGKAGTGKTTLLKQILESTHKNTVVVAPTGIAALNAGGVTIHSMFQLPFNAFVPTSSSQLTAGEQGRFENIDTLRRHFRMSGQKKAVLENMELLIIDEVSMLRCDTTDAIDFMLRTVRKIATPFGGVQVVFIGDLLQLPPVVKDNEWSTMKRFYSGKFFFHSQVVSKHPPLFIELTKVYRQTDQQFINILNNLRNNFLAESDLSILNQLVDPRFDLKQNPGYITLTTHNHKADHLNAASLKELSGKEFTYDAEIVGDFPDKIYPLDKTLRLKVGAQIMFIKNDQSFEKLYYNGRLGIIKRLDKSEITVEFKDTLQTISVMPYEWTNIRYSVNADTREIVEETLGTFTHYPIKLAWAITVHKSQGLTFDKAALDVTDVFMPGQAYVALSRLRSLNGLVLLSALQMNGITNDRDVMQYSESRTSEVELKNYLEQDSRSYLLQFLKNCFDWEATALLWRKHYFNYKSHQEYSEWAEKHHILIDGTLRAASGFRSQLDKLFSSEPDLNFILERTNAAFDYFFNLMDPTLSDVMLRLEEMKRIKKAKEYYMELAELEEGQLLTNLKLMKARLIAGMFAQGEQLSKDSFETIAIREYKNNKKEEVRSTFKSLYGDLTNEPTFEHERKKKTQAKSGKKSTVVETYELWLEKKSIKDIAATRKLTEGTIMGHIAQLIKTRAIPLSEVMPDDKITDMSRMFGSHEGKTLTELRELSGERFTFEEMRLYKSAIEAEGLS